MKTQHTPGPWKLVKGSHYQTIRVENHVIADMRIIGGHFPYNLHDAALIAAATELLGALENLLSYAEDAASDRDERPYCIIEARAAIQKVRGE